MKERKNMAKRVPEKVSNGQNDNNLVCINVLLILCNT